ncbi:hypothetical protein N7452_011200 [Penicillium brevicompactum]|uniref:Uncharacterized protein n=1 Tax=Penicillium brevicompactum TaxID=5074 RepID=A0A9W9Q5S5_PENBR|nr:hypothetical protein N7452_011200 [Penicillium brevicompactum]
MTSQYDLIVVGAGKHENPPRHSIRAKNTLVSGWFGLAAAKHYIQLHPYERITIIESASTCGGTWAEHRLYPGLKSNNMVGSYEYPDFPMGEAYGVKPNSHIPAATLHRYLSDYARRFGVFERVVFDTTVETIERHVGGWVVKTCCAKGSAALRTRRLILATGLTSTPNIPSYPGQETFDAPLFHAKDFRNCGAWDNSQNVVVVGGAKSAFDVAFAYAEAGVHVDLIIRPDGNGPVWLSPAFVTPLKRKMEELLHTRCLTWMSPTPWGDEDGFSLIHRLLHGTKIGRMIVRAFWQMLSSDIVEANGYDDYKYPSLAPLRPWTSAFWTGSGVSIHNYDSSFFEFVKNGTIRVHTANISLLSPRKVHLSTDEVLDADALICATGWKKRPSFNFSNWDIKIQRSVAEMTELIQAADEEILSRFPILKAQPLPRSQTKPTDPLRLYRFMVPPALWEDRSLAFAGMVSSVSTSTCASLQGLWISVYLDGKLDRTPVDDTEAVRETVLNSQWGKWRYPCGYGGEVADLAFDALPYFDLLLRDLGLESRRKTSCLAEMITPYKPWDYRSVVMEWMDAHPIKSDS